MTPPPCPGCGPVSCHLEASRTFLLQKKCPNSGPVAYTGQRQGPKVPRRNCWNQDSDCWRGQCHCPRPHCWGQRLHTDLWLERIIPHQATKLPSIPLQSLHQSGSGSQWSPLRPQSSRVDVEPSGAQSLSLGPWSLIHEPKQPLGPPCLAPALPTYLGQAQSGTSS